MELLRITKRGGRVWFTQPNLNATGRHVFGKYWRGFEAPRHLCLFDTKAFMVYLKDAGFTDVKLLTPQPCAVDYFRTSLLMTEGTVPRHDAVPAGWNSRWLNRARKADIEAVRAPENGESLTVVASRPS